MSEQIKASFRVLFFCLVCGAGYAFAFSVLKFNPFGFTMQVLPRTAFVIAFFVFLAQLFRKDLEHCRGTLMIIALALTQFYHVFLGWDYPAGSLSLMRLLPYFVLVAVAWLFRRPNQTKLRIPPLVALIFIAFLSSVDITTVGAVHVFLLAVVVPCLLSSFRQQENARDQILAGSLWAFLILCFGTIVVIQAASQVELGGLQGYLATRNVSDFNLIIGYLLLLWPMAIFSTRDLGWWASLALSGLFIITCYFGLSRATLVIAPLIIALSLGVLYWNQKRQLLIMVCAAGVLFWGAFFWLAQSSSELLTAWALRLNLTPNSNISQVLDGLKPGGEDGILRDQIRNEAIRMFNANPLVGVGFGGYRATSEVGFTDAHSLTFTTLAEFGLLGYGALLALFCVIGLRLLWVMGHRPVNRSLAQLLLIGFGGWLLIAHTVGASILMAAESGFAVSASTPILLGLYWLAGEWL